MIGRRRRRAGGAARIASIAAIALGGGLGIAVGWALLGPSAPGEPASVLPAMAPTGARAADRTPAAGAPSGDTRIAAVLQPTPKPAAAPPAPRTKTVRIAKGDTLMEVLTGAGAPREEAHRAIQAMQKVFDPRRLRPGQAVHLTFNPAPPMPTGEAANGKAPAPATPAPVRLAGLRLEESLERHVEVRHENGRYGARAIDRPLETRMHLASGRIDDSLYLEAVRADVPAPIIIGLIHLYSFDIDFQRDIHPGDTFTVFYETLHDESGLLARAGEIDHALLRVRGHELALYRFVFKDGTVDYFNAKGQSVRKALMKTPVDGARLSSRFGRRKHPILGYNKMHRGVDFAAPRGTPVMAAGDGTVETAGWNGAYGRYLRIRHNGSYKTAYAHLTGFHRGIKKGRRVRQGQIVAYVGSTGRSTGPHLHYEILHNGRRINPMGLKLPSGRKLQGATLADFQTHRAAIDAAVAAAAESKAVADSN